MLKHLRIENYALIRKADLDFTEGFTAITGETGAGKSIMLGALGLILGNRADMNVLWNKEQKCTVEATFLLEERQWKVFFDEYELDYDTTTLLRREILANGKTRAFVNDSPVALTVMKALGDRIVNIHSQHETITLNDAGFQLEMVDSFCEHSNILLEWKQLFDQYHTCKKQLADLEKTAANANQKLSLAQFLFDELLAAKLQEGEQERWEEEMNLLQHADTVKQVVQEGIFLLDTDENAAVLQRLSHVVNLLEKKSDDHAVLRVLSQRISTVVLELKDVIQEFSHIDQQVQASPEKMQEVSSRIDLIYALQSKHRVKTVQELIAIQKNLEQELTSVSNLEGEIEKLNNQKSFAQQQMHILSKTLNHNRIQAANTIEKLLHPLLLDLGMPHAQCKIAISSLDHFTERGMDQIVFLFSANQGGDLQPLVRVASGGELSRLMLAIKAVLMNDTLLPTIIFDEIDTGVSGDIAGKVAKIMKRMSKHMQVIAITHLPQLAAQATEHFSVYKQTVDEQTQSQIVKLSDQDRIMEIAKMLSGENVSQAAINNAIELLNG